MHYLILGWLSRVDTTSWPSGAASARKRRSDSMSLLTSLLHDFNEKFGLPEIKTTQKIDA